MKISRMNRGSWDNILAFFDIETEDGFTIKGFRFIKGENGRFVGFPSQKNKDGDYHDTVWADKELKERVVEMAKREYDGSATRQEDTMPLAAQGGPADEGLPF
tara:strand:+ start:303 stop:611 length:309 start_codon:yes stop_codon:yes gene_type:complete